jgi:deoxycytidylate deaminase
MIDTVMKKLLKIAEKVEPVSKARLAAAILYKKKIVSVGTNKYKTHPIMYKFKKNDQAIFLHAEVDAIVKASKKLTEKQMGKAELIVVRVLNDGTPAISKPCDGCKLCISDYNIKKTYYIKENGCLTSANL